MNNSVLYIKRVLYGNQKQASNAMDFVSTRVHETIFAGHTIESEVAVVDFLTKYLQRVITGEEKEHMDVVELIVGLKSMKVLSEGNCILQVKHINETSPKVRFKFVKPSKDVKSDTFGTNLFYWNGAKESSESDNKADIDAELSDQKLGNVPGNTLIRLHEYRDKLLPMVTDEIRSQTSDTYEMCLLAAKDYYSNA